MSFWLLISAIESESWKKVEREFENNNVAYSIWQSKCATKLENENSNIIDSEKKTDSVFFQTNKKTKIANTKRTTKSIPTIKQSLARIQ